MFNKIWRSIRKRIPKRKINNKIHIAIVNEDQPTQYNGKKVELGQALIKRLANEKNYKFETVTRNVAESGLKMVDTKS